MRDWFLMEASRTLVVVLLLASFFVALLLLGTYGPGSATAIYEAAEPVRTAFRALVLGVITSVTLVLTINQVVLSQEFGPLHEQQKALEGVTHFMDDLERLVGAGVTPAEPARFLVYHLGAIQREAQGLVEIGSEVPPAESTRMVAESEGSGNSREGAESVGGRAEETSLGERVVEYGRTVARESDDQLNQLESARFGSFGLIRILLHHPYSRLVREARGLLAAQAGSLPDGARLRLVRILDLLVLFGGAREHFKTLHFRRELLKLSQGMMLVALPALLVALSTVLFYDPAAISGVTAGMSDTLLIVCAAATIAISPLVLLIVYILRIATVTNRTLAVGPFVLDA